MKRHWYEELDLHTPTKADKVVMNPAGSFDYDLFEDVRSDILYLKKNKYSFKRKYYPELYDNIDKLTEWLENEPNFSKYTLNDMAKRETIAVGINPKNIAFCNFCSEPILPDARGRFHGFCGLSCINKNNYHKSVENSRYNELFQRDFYEKFRDAEFDMETIYGYFNVAKYLIDKRMWNLGLYTSPNQMLVLKEREFIKNKYGIDDHPSHFSYPLQVINCKDLLYSIWQSNRFSLSSTAVNMGLPKQVVLNNLKYFGYSPSGGFPPHTKRIISDDHLLKSVYQTFCNDLIKTADFLEISAESLADKLYSKGIVSPIDSCWAGKSIKDRDVSPSYLYILKLSNDNEIFYKIGVSNNPRRRLNEILKSSNFKYAGETIRVYHGDRWKCYVIESLLLRKIGSVKYNPIFEFAGNSECIHPAFLSRSIKTLDYIENKLDQMEVLV